MKAGTLQTVERALMSRYLNDEQSMTVKEVVEFTKLGSTIVRRALRESTKISFTKKPVEVMSRDYPGHVHQTRVVEAYRPSRSYLVDYIRKGKREQDWLAYQRTFR